MANYNYNTFGGFYAPGSLSGQYVATKRDDQGSYLYDKAAQEIGIQKQAALQNLSETYGNVVNNAYASYLANQRNVGASQMGQGYKDAYNQMLQQTLLNNIEQANLSAAQTRQELEQTTQEAQENVYQQYLTEVSNLDRADLALQNYYNYLNSLGYFGQETFRQKYPDYKYNNLGQIESDNTLLYRDLYEDLLSAQPQSWQVNGQYVTDSTGQRLQPFLDYTKSQAGTKQEDTDWLTWFNYLGGYQDYINALAKSAAAKRAPIAVIEAEKRAKEEAEKRAKEEAEKRAKEEAEAATTGIVYDDLKDKTAKFEKGAGWPTIDDYYLNVDGTKYKLLKRTSHFNRPDYATYLDVVDKVKKLGENQIIRYNQSGRDRLYYMHDGILYELANNANYKK